MPVEAVWAYRRLERARWLVSLSALAAAVVLGIAAMGFLVTFAWPSTGLGDPDARIYAGNVDDFEVNSPVFNRDGRFWLVRQPDDAFVAFAAADSFRGCRVVWRGEFRYTDPRDGSRKQGWYRDPCHGSIYDPDGTKVFGPSPRDLDSYPVEVAGQRVIVHAADRHLIHGEMRFELQPFGPRGG